MAPISVLLPIHAEAPHLAPAIESILEQSLAPDEILLLMHAVPAGAPTRVVAMAYAEADPHVRLVEVPTGSLSTVLNAGLRESSCPLVARMDSDDLSHPDRFALQADFLDENPRVIGVGCAFERIDREGNLISVVHPPTAPGELRWRLLIENCFAHGSMMLRREPLVRAGGYDERTGRAQDYELWTRLARGHDLANLPQVLYRYRTTRFVTRPDPEQAATVARVLLREWRALSIDPRADRVGAIMADLFSGTGSTRDAMEAIEHELSDAHPSVERLLAYLVARVAHPPLPREVIEAGRLSRLRETATKLTWHGVSSLWLYGAGRHSDWILAHENEIPQQILGIVDDRRHGERLGHITVQRPEAVAGGADVLLSSDTFEDELWEASAPLRERGVRVWRLYAPQPAGTSNEGGCLQTAAAAGR